MIKQFVDFIIDIIAKKSLLWELVKRDLKNRIAGSFLGIFWVFVQPVITIVIFWIVFEVGFKSTPVKDFPFVMWLAAGMVPWFFFAEGLIFATSSIAENSFLVKKVAFRVSLLPIMRILSALLVHVFFMIVLFLMLALYGHYPDLYYLQLFYYLFALIILLTGLSLIASASVLFFKDIGQFIQAILQFLFWGTPIFWSLKIMPEKYHTLIKLNPLYYITTGYRDCLIDKVWLWEHPALLLYYWTVASVIFFLGVLFFRKLKPHFGDIVK